MIELHVKTERNINELTSDELSMVIWSRFPYSQFEIIDVPVYRKLNAEGREYVNTYINDYHSRPVEYWDEVFKHNVSNSFCLNLFDTCVNKIEVYERYKCTFDSNLSFELLYSLGIKSFIEFFEHNGMQAITDHDDYTRLLEPNIPISFFNQKHDDNKTVLEYIFEELESGGKKICYPILLPNEVLVAAGFPAVPNFSEITLDECDACDYGREIVLPWIEKLGTDGVLEWDTVVSYIREHPELIKSFIGELEWWWDNNLGW